MQTEQTKSIQTLHDEFLTLYSHGQYFEAKSKSAEIINTYRDNFQGYIDLADATTMLDGDSKHIQNLRAMASKLQKDTEN